MHLAFGFKYSGTEKYPQVKVFAHFDIIRMVKSHEKHFADRTEKRVMKEMYKIGKLLEAEQLSFLEEKDQKCAHGTLNIEHKQKIMEYIKRYRYK